jgi:hypothetical protein
MNPPSGEFVSGAFIGALLTVLVMLALRGLGKSRARQTPAEPWQTRSSSSWAPAAGPLLAATPPAGANQAVACASCSAPLAMQPGGRLPPWCAACGADVKRSPQRSEPAAAAADEQAQADEA